MPALDLLPDPLRARLRPLDAAELTQCQPMLAKPTARRAFADDWVFERKLDGIRVLALREGGRVRLRSRTGKPLDASYPELAAALRTQPAPAFAVDGEITAMRGDRTDFGLLQRRMGLTEVRAIARTGVPVVLHLFDLLWLDGQDVRPLPLRARKALLRRAVEFTEPLRFTPHRTGEAEQLLAEACARGWEGLIAKRAESPYRPGRGDDWLKLKCLNAQEFVVGGFTDPAGASRSGFGALLVGYYEEGRLRYAGKVGTGFDTQTLHALRGFLDATGRPDPPFDPAPRERGAHWVRPLLVVQVGFGEWTAAGLLRHPRYLGVRDDRPPTEVVREQGRPGDTA
ncbi:non-homologous end-joining DNA ligase [Kitasatospora viridis]|uniref:DNA ligase (ATP) n=1 Tax=Kitasatospora viridis TaxID=281105 RepID=A0A561UQ42_9ACTN|nr:non-homologous end-joining DNA ligase [Kitasatospora viridis]TWG01486.1 bifunctional non-homologous end joining protein LigD [Kitasatospora viridis]